MANKRVYEAAKEFGIPAKDLIAKIAEAGLGKKSNFSALDDDELTALTEWLESSNGAPAATTPKKSEAKKPASKTATAKTEENEATTESASDSTPIPKAEPPADAQPQVKAQQQPEAQASATAKQEKASDKADEEAELQRLLAEEAAAEAAAKAEREKIKAEKAKADANKVPRPPVVTILGHVDHGKTTLLDYIRHTKVVDAEAGGITQSIGAYQAEYNGHKITFIDTPGHAAFTNMRARGAQATDIVILVVAADDGVMAQTEEAIAHAKSAGVPILVAINKIDKAPDRLDRVKQDLAQRELTPEDWGGDTITVPLSALNGDGVDDLLEMILLTAELNEFKADPNGPVEVVVIESHLDSQKGAITSVLVKEGTLHCRDAVVADTSVGRIRSLMDDHGNPMQEVGPGTPAQLLGLDEVPAAGARLEVVESLNEAKDIAYRRKEEQRQKRLAPQRKSMSDLMSQMLQKGKLRLVLKADSAGALEVMVAELKKIELKDVEIDILHTGVGPIGESDVMLAVSGEDMQAAVIGFRTTVDKNAADKAQSFGLTLRTYNIIYDLTREVERALRRMLEPEYREVKLGEVEVRDVFKIPRLGTVAGCYVRDGTVMRSGQIRVFRDGVEIHEGPIRNLKRFDQDARQVEKGKECGILLQDFNDIQVGDSLENFKMEKVEI